MISDAIIGKLCKASHELDALLCDIHLNRPAARTLGAVEERIQGIADQMRAAVRGETNARPIVTGVITAERLVGRAASREA